MKILKTTVLLLMMSVTLFSCKKDEASKRNAEKEFTHSGLTYEIKNAAISHTNGNEHILVFYTEGLSLNAAKDNLEGKGNVVYFTIYNSEIEGEYFFGNGNMEFNNSECVLDFDPIAGTFATQDSIENGSISISPYFDGGYRISIENDPVVDLIYEGELELANFQ